MTWERVTRRRQERQPLALRVDVLGFLGPSARWSESTRSLDLSKGGASFLLTHAVIPGQVLQIQMALPKALRRFDLEAPVYNVFAIVRFVGEGPPPRKLGVMFYGKTPPAGFSENPAASFLLPNNLPDVRRFPRHPIVLTVRLTVPGLSAEEVAITQVLSLGGARLMVARRLNEGDIVHVDIDGGAVRTTARVRTVVTGEHDTFQVSVTFLDVGSREATRVLLKRLGL